MDNLTTTKTVSSGGGAGESSKGEVWSVSLAVFLLINVVF